MEDNLKFDPVFSTRVPDRRIAALRVGLCVIAALAILAAVFQFFLRYQYIEQRGVVWRIDRVTQQKCRLVNGHADCSAKPPSTSVSTSVSTSISVSTFVPSGKRHAHRI
jgi:hypothetical protein